MTASMRPDDGQAQAIGSICIVGGGTAGWSAAALLSQVLRGSGCRITLVESSAIPTVGVGEATIPPIFDFLRNIGADEVEFIRRCQATFKLGIQFRDWLHHGHAYWHPFGNLGVTINQRPFHHYYCMNRAAGHGETLADLCPSVALAEAGKFAFPSPDGQWPGGAVAYALHFDAGLVAAFLRDHAVAAGVERLDRRIVGATRGEGERIAGVQFDDGESLEADFYIDCSGFRGLLIEETLVGLDVLGREVELREKGGEPVRTDEGNYVLDLHLNRIGNARQLGLALNQIAGVVENGLFVDICDTLILGHGDGKVERFELDGAAEVTQFDFLAADNIFTDISD